jgi:hypothetical protein
MRLRAAQIAAVAREHSLRTLAHFAQPPAFIPDKSLIDELPREAVAS